MNKHFHLIRAALDLRQGKEYAQAVALLEQAIQEEPGYVPAYIYLGLAYQDQEKYTEAESAFRQALVREPENPEALQCLGMLYLKQERYAEAIINLQKHLQLEPDNETSLDVLTPLLVKAGRTGEAKAFLRAAWEKNKDPRAAVRTVRFLIGQEELDEARQFLEEALQAGENANLLVELALVLVIQKEYEKATQALQQAIRLRPEYDRALRGLAHCYTQMGQTDKAIEYAERALAVGPRHYRNWQAKADALILAGRYEDALQAANMGIQIVKDSAPAEQEEAYPVLGVLYLQRFNAQRLNGQVDAALAGLVEARQAIPEDDRFYTFPARILIQADQPDKAFEILQAAVNAPISGAALGEIIQGLMGKGVDLYQSGDTCEARRIFEGLVEQTPGIPHLNTAAAYVLTGDGELDRAEELLELALKEADDEQRGICLCDLGYIQLLRGQYDRAIASMNEALQAPDCEAFLRIAFWLDGELIADYKPHPIRWVSTHWAAVANLTALGLARNDLGQAQALAKQLQEQPQHACTSNLIMGCVAHANGQMEAARQNWEAARGCAEDQGEVDLVENWLQFL